MSFFSELYDGAARPGEGQRMFSVTTGRVVENWDEKHPGMVQVEVFLGEDGKNRTDWVRVAQPYGGKECGFYFLPEVGDEVVLAFNLGDRDHPIVIGSLWSQLNPLPKNAAAEKNQTKVLRTKGGNELAFSDEEKKEALQLHTKGNLTLVMEDEPVEITLCDKDRKNLLTISGKEGTVTIKAEKKVVLDVGGGSLTLDGQGKKATLKMDTISIEAGQSLNLKGQNVKLEGSMMKVSSSGNLEAQASGILTLKGSMTKIN